MSTAAGRLVRRSSHLLGIGEDLLVDVSCSAGALPLASERRRRAVGVNRGAPALQRARAAARTESAR